MIIENSESQRSIGHHGMEWTVAISGPNLLIRRALLIFFFPLVPPRRIMFFCDLFKHYIYTAHQLHLSLVVSASSLSSKSLSNLPVIARLVSPGSSCQAGNVTRPGSYQSVSQMSVTRPAFLLFSSLPIPDPSVMHVSVGPGSAS